MVQLLAMAGFVLIMVSAFLRHKDKYTYFCVGISLPIFMVLLLPLSVITTWLQPWTVDGALRRADLFLHLDGFKLTLWMIHSGAQRFFVVPFYSGLPIMMALAWLTNESRTLLRAVVIGAVLAIPCYLLVPAVGPQYAFTGFPYATAVFNHAGIGLHPRNCFPSMHFSWALLLAFNVRTTWQRSIFLVYAAGMSIAVVASGEHYFVDVIAAIPFTFTVQYLATCLDIDIPSLAV